MLQHRRPKRPAPDLGTSHLAKSQDRHSPSYEFTINDRYTNVRRHVRSAEGVPATLSDKTGTAEIDQNASVAGPKDDVFILNISMNFSQCQYLLKRMPHGEYLFPWNAGNSWRPQSAQDSYVSSSVGARLDSFLPDQTDLMVGWLHLVLVRGLWRVVRDSNSGCLQRNLEVGRCWDVLSPPCPRSIRNHLRLRIGSGEYQQGHLEKDPTADVGVRGRTYLRLQT